MRSKQKDIRRTQTLTTMLAVIDGATGNGIWSDGTPWHMVRTATGEYTMYFDTRLFVVSATVGPTNGGEHFYQIKNPSAGLVRVEVIDGSGNPVNFAGFDVTLNVLDSRT